MTTTAPRPEDVEIVTLADLDDARETVEIPDDYSPTSTWDDDEIPADPTLGELPIKTYADVLAAAGILDDPHGVLDRYMPDAGAEGEDE